MVNSGPSPLTTADVEMVLAQWPLNPAGGSPAYSLKRSEYLKPSAPSELSAPSEPSAQLEHIEHLDPAQEPLGSVYARLMTVYSVVKAGGVAVQIEAAQALLQRETAALESDIAALAPEVATHQAAPLRQDIRDLQNGIRWRIEQLQQILPEEEAVVTAAIAAIEAKLTVHNR